MYVYTYTMQRFKQYSVFLIPKKRFGKQRLNTPYTRIQKLWSNKVGQEVLDKSAMILNDSLKF